MEGEPVAATNATDIVSPEATAWEDSSMLTHMGPPSLIMPQIYLGCFDNAHTAAVVRAAGITAILCCADEFNVQLQENCRWHHIPLVDDAPDEHSEARFRAAIGVLRSWVAAGETVLVHCWCVVSAYLVPGRTGLEERNHS